MKTLHYVLALSVAWLLNVQLGYAQQPDLMDDRDTIHVLVFQHPTKDLTKLISEGGRIRYKVSETKRSVKGVLQEIKPHSMVVSGREIKFNECSFIAGRVKTEAEVAGAVAAGIGLPTMIFGVAFFTTLQTGGAVAVIAGGAVSLVAGIVVLTKMRKFNLNKGWEVHGGTLVFDRT